MIPAPASARHRRGALTCARVEAAAVAVIRSILDTKRELGVARSASRRRARARSAASPGGRVSGSVSSRSTASSQASNSGSDNSFMHINSLQIVADFVQGSPQPLRHVGLAQSHQRGNGTIGVTRTKA